jgi:hypothetical protein
MAKGGGLARSMTGFAAGVMHSIDPRATKKMMSTTARNTMGFKAGRGTGKFMTSGITSSVANMKKGDDLFKAISKGHMKAGTNNLSAAKVAGSVATLGVAGRVATGGGLYRDRYGNVNVPGVPFI